MLPGQLRQPGVRLPYAQEMHVVEARPVNITLPQYPGAQAVQAVALSAEEYALFGQSGHGPGLPYTLLNVPARQFWQVLGSVAAGVGEYVPGAQEEQLVKPVPVAYVPARQSWHIVIADPPLDVENLPAGQLEQVVLPTAPRTAEYVPAEQGEHVRFFGAPSTVE